MKRGKCKPKQLKWSELEELRDKLLERQKHICPICKKRIENPVLDHHHVRRVKGTGRIRGVLCRQCNVLLGKVENNCVRYKINQEELPFVLENMARYLLTPQQPYIHPSETPKEPKLMKSSYNELAKTVEENGKYKMPEYPKSGRLTVRLAELFEKFGIEPKFYNVKTGSRRK